MVTFPTPYGCDSLLKKFLSIFLLQFPDRFACLVIILGIVSLGSFAYDTVGLPIQTASAEGASGGDSAVNAAVNWVYLHKCFGDRIRPDTIRASVLPADGGSYRVTLDFTSLEYRIDLDTGGLHHIPFNHTVDLLVAHGRVVSAAEGLRDLIRDPAYGPVTVVSSEGA